MPRTATLEAHPEPNLLGGLVTLSAIGSRAGAENWGRDLYRSEPPATEEKKLKAVPYFAWDNRDPARCWSG
ncbi:hypothetical protein [Mesorhizobium sp. WSM3224]|uniref:hypothetical protein n=1 Tax=Mesorhizobium sp. WSM3224 TaxID=1040986 RepID=UPI000419ED70|nr:hypothetical protein [Mesorhizobium sp. WSM3224]